MKKLIFLSIISTLAVLLSSCVDALNEELVSEVSTDSYYTTPSGFESAVNAAYAPLRSIIGQYDSGDMTEYGTDIIGNAGHGHTKYLNLYSAALNSESGVVTNMWNTYYTAINTCNAAVSRSLNIDMNQVQKNRLLAEVRYLRAFYYFSLVQHFGAIHLSLEETVGVETEANRTPPAEIYEQVIADLEFAVNNLPAEAPDWGRVSQPTAKMLLSQVLLTRGYMDFAGNDDYQRAATLAESVINDYNFQLLEDFEMIFDHDNEKNSEIIWSVQYGTDQILNSSGNTYHMLHNPWYETYSHGLVRSLEYGRPWIHFKPTPYALKNFRPLDQDARYKKSFQDTWRYNDASSIPTFPNASNSNPTVGDTAIYIDPDMTAQEVEQNQDNTSYYLMSFATVHNEANLNMWPRLKKHIDTRRPSINHPAGSKDIIVFRLAEAYLFAAEAHFQMGNHQSSADHINAVRRRAAWPGHESNMEISAGDVTLNFILDERAREFYGEEKRWLTLKRTGRLLDRVRAYGNPSETRNNIDQRHLLRPIPATQIERTEGGYEQNPGY